MTIESSLKGLTVAVTGTAWMGGGVISVQSAIEELFNNANKEILIGIYEITSGADDFLKKLGVCLARGIRVRMVINRYNDKPPFVKKKIACLIRKYPYFEVLNFQPETESEDLHAKIIVIDRDKALVGSANLTWRGLVGNHELAVIVHGPVASRIASLFDKLCQDSRVIKLA
jgi:phosphatidylserine/phosphatidylglycerophosphate/cardiolipin synthase-like enzyme